MTRFRKLILAAALTLLAACGGGNEYDPDCSAGKPAPVDLARQWDAVCGPATYSYSQSAGAGSVSAVAAVQILSIGHSTGPVTQRLRVTASIDGARTSLGSMSSVRWVIRQGALVLAEGPLMINPPATGTSGSAEYEVNVSGNTTVTVEIVGTVVGAGVLQWNGATLTVRPS